MIIKKEIDLLVFLRDPLGKHPHEPNIHMLQKICGLRNVPLATNSALNELMLKSIFDR